MVHSMRHRGPDDTGYFQDAHISLGIARLSVMDPLTGAQPITNENGTVHVVANCELYDFEATRRDLEFRSHRFHTKSDAEILIHLYEDFGLGMFDHIEGMFAFALWDSRLQRLLLARDRFGIKPLFYSSSDSRPLAFASELSPLSELPWVSRDLDPTAVDEYFALSFIPHPRTVFRAIKKLPPGSYLLAQRSGYAIKPFWLPPFVVETPTEASSLTELDRAIQNAVRRAMRSDAPYGAFLSGGLDSTTVVYHMAQLSNAPIRTYSLRYAEQQYDEGPLARETASLLKTAHTEVWCEPRDLLLMPDLITNLGEPLADPAQIPTYLICKKANEAVKVLLSGDGGDELFGGYRAYCASLLCDRYPSLWHILSGISQRTPGLPSWCSSYFSSHEERIRKFLSGSQLEGAERHAAWRTIIPQEDRALIYSKSFMDYPGVPAYLPILLDRHTLFEGAGRRELLTACQYLDVDTYLTDNNLAKVDRMSMATSIEVRIPLLDATVFDTAMRLPRRLRVSGMRTKDCLRRILKNRVPRSVLRLPKRGFPVPLSGWFRGPLRKHVEHTLSTARLEKVTPLSTVGVQKLVRQHMSGRLDRARALWSILCFVYWYERYIGS